MTHQLVKIVMAAIAVSVVACSFGAAPQKDKSEKVAQERYEKQLKLLPAKLQKLAKTLQPIPADNQNAVIAALGKPTKDIGSGVHIWEWDLPEGTLTFGAPGLSRPAFKTKSGQWLWLVRTRTPIEQSITSSQELFSHSAGMNEGWVGNLDMSPDGSYSYKNSEPNNEVVHGQENSFFVKHPTGKFTISYPKGIEPTTQLESIAKKGVVASIHFSSSDGSAKANFDVECDPATRLLKFVGPVGTPFELDWSF